jgi:hypothetical protein
MQQQQQQQVICKSALALGTAFAEGCCLYAMHVVVELMGGGAHRKV